ncbi:MAG: hypothetical protein HY084_11570 [Gemmatimonadetes bacterium]|nr:hypothetical protein [Gemmatimonadota bacterium]
MSVPLDVLDFVKAHRVERTLSAYLDGSTTDPAERRHWRVELKQEITRLRDALAGATRAERDQFEGCVSRLLERVPPGEQMPGTPGWVCFCSASGDVHTEALPTRTTTLVVWRDGPFVVPLLSADVADHAVLAIVDWNGAGLWRLADGRLAHGASVTTDAHIDVGPHMGDAPRRGFHGGTRGNTQTDEAQRQLREARARMIDATAHRIASMANGDVCVVVGGAAEAAAALVKALPQGLAVRTVVAPDLRVQSPNGEVVRLARATLARLNEHRQAQRLDEWQRLAHRGGHAAFGLESIAAAAIAGAVERIVVSRRLCADDPDRVEDIVQLALIDGARVETAGDALSERLDAEAGGIAAELRFVPAAVGDDAAAPRALVHR